MIYLIGGSPRGGKSILSKELAKQLNIPYISTDNLRPVIIPYFKKRKFEFFPFEKMFDADNIDKYFKKYTGREMLNADIKEAKTMWPGVKNLIEYLLKCKMDYIIEGVDLLPSMVNQFKSENNIKAVYLIKLDSNKIYQGILDNKNSNDWITGNTQNKESILKAADSLIPYGNYFLREAKKYNFKYFNTEDDFHSQIKEAVNYLKLTYA